MFQSTVATVRDNAINYKQQLIISLTYVDTMPSTHHLGRKGCQWKDLVTPIQHTALT